MTMDGTKKHYTPEVHADASAEALDEARDAVIPIMDALSALRGIVTPMWDSLIEADRMRNALQWLADKADDDARALLDALDKVRR